MRLPSLFAFACLALPVCAREQKYDDGKPDGSKSFADVGCGTWFDGPVDATCVRIHAARGKARAFDVAALDRDGGVLAQAAYDAAALPEQAGWAKLAFPVQAEEGALIVVTFNEGEEGSLSWDKNDERHSTYFYGGNHHPFEEGNWMMRLAPGDGAKPLEFAAAALPAGQVVRADRGEGDWSVPESIHVFPASGTNYRVKLGGARVSSGAPYVLPTTWRLPLGVPPTMLMPPVPTMISRMPLTGSAAPDTFMRAKRS